MRPLELTALALALSLVSGSGVAGSPQSNSPQTSPATPQASTPSAIPQSERERPNPLKPDPRSLEEGRLMYSSQCAMCHGAKGDGKGDLVPRLGLKMPDLSDPKLQAKRTDGEWFYIITQGHGQMPGEGDRLAATRKWQLINLMRTLAPPPRTTP